MSNNLGIWYRETISPTQTNISPPPLRKNFFEDESSTPLGDEGTQNSIDNCINRKTKIKISYDKISKEFFTENFMSSDVKKYIEKSKLIDPEYKNITSKLKKDIPNIGGNIIYIQNFFLRKFNFYFSLNFLARSK